MVVPAGHRRWLGMIWDFHPPRPCTQAEAKGPERRGRGQRGARGKAVLGDPPSPSPRSPPRLRRCCRLGARRRDAERGAEALPGPGAPRRAAAGPRALRAPTAGRRSGRGGAVRGARGRRRRLMQPGVGGKGIWVRGRMFPQWVRRVGFWGGKMRLHFPPRRHRFVCFVLLCWFFVSLFSGILCYGILGVCKAGCVWG